MQVLAIAVAALGEILAVVFVYRVLVRGGSPASTLLWMGVILAAPWFGLLLYYLLPRQLQRRRLRRLQRSGQRLRSTRRRLVGEAESPVGAADWPEGVGAAGGGLRALLAASDGGLDAGNRLQWLPDGEDFFRAARGAIEQATGEVLCLVYIFRPDVAGQRFLALLAAAARRGVTVRLLYDSLGSFGLKAHHLQDLVAAGGRAEAFLPLLWKRRPFTVNLRNHRKLLVVDGRIAILGGRNVGDEYFNDRFGRSRRWLDGMLAIEGPAVSRLREVFVEDWCMATEEVLAEAQPQAPRPDGAEVGIVCSGPDREESELWFAVVQAIADAADEVLLSSPYLVPPPTLLFALQMAAARGVRVRLFTNGPATEAWILYHAQRSYYARWLAAGIEVWQSLDVYNHAKLLVVDRRTVMVGSANMDLRSRSLNFEIAAIAIDAPELASAVVASLAERESSFRRVQPHDLPAQPWRRAIDGFCGLLSPLL